MKTLEIVAYKRENFGSKSSKDIRNEGYVPCVMYGGKENVHFYAPAILFRDLVYTKNVHFVKLNVEGDEYDCVLQDIQFHPVSEMILHADFLEFNEKSFLKMEVPVKVTGSSPGVMAGGKVMSKMRKLKVRALPQNMPEFIEVDITGIELGKSAKVRDIATENYEILNSPGNPILSIEIPRALRGKQAAEEGEEEETEA